MPTLVFSRHTVRRFTHDVRAATTVEFAMVLWPLIAIIMMCLQIALHQYVQSILSNTLFDTAATPPALILSGDQSGYKSEVCDKIPFIKKSTCVEQLLIEMSPLSEVPVARTEVTGRIFSVGQSMSVMILRAAIPTPRIFPALPQGWAKASVVFRRP